MPSGVIEGGLEYVVWAYVVSGLVLATYVGSMVWRAHKEKVL